MGGMLNVFFPGKYAGKAFADNIFGVNNPSAKTPIFYPKEEEGTIVPCVEQTGPYRDCNYTEGLNIAWYNRPAEEILFPFGHGLSYTEYTYSNPQVHVGVSNAKTQCENALGWDMDRGASIVCVTADVENSPTGRTGDEIAQMYLEFPAEADEPSKLLKGFNRLENLAPGAKETAKFPLQPRDLQVYDMASGEFKFVAGTYKYFVGKSAGDLPLSGQFTMDADGNPSSLFATVNV